MAASDEDNVVLFGLPERARAVVGRVDDIVSRQHLTELYRLGRKLTTEARALDDVIRAAKESEQLIRYFGDQGRREARAELAAAVESYTKGHGRLARASRMANDWLDTRFPVRRVFAVAAGVAVLTSGATIMLLVGALKDATRELTALKTTSLLSVAIKSGEVVGDRAKVTVVTPGSMIHLQGKRDGLDQVVLRWRSPHLPLAAYYCSVRPLPKGSVVGDGWGSVFGTSGITLPGIGSHVEGRGEYVGALELRCEHMFENTAIVPQIEPGRVYTWWQRVLLSLGGTVTTEAPF